MTYSWLKKYVDKQTAGLSGVTGGGEWMVEQYYEKGTLVTNNGKVYIAIQDVPEGTTLSNTAYWSLLLENSDVTDILNLDSALEGQIPYLGPNGKIIWKNLSLRRDNDYNYQKIENTFIPANGEICLVDTARDGLRFKCGDGIHTYAELDYIDAFIVKGYYNDNNFYKDALHTELITGSEFKIYRDLSKGGMYYFDGNNYQSMYSGGPLPTASATTAGIVKLYNTVGYNTDGTMTQKAICDELDDKVEISLNLEEETLIFSN